VKQLPDKFIDAALKLKLLILDVDGVLTDGTLAYTKNGEEVKNFNSKDGFGIRMLMQYGIEVAVITARHSPPLAKRMTDLKIKNFYTGMDNKEKAFSMLLNKLSLKPEETGYVGDDILDLPVMKKVGLPIAVSDAHFYVKKQALWITEFKGGKGAVREVADAIIACKTNIDEAYELFLADLAKNSDLKKV
jgi:3-deoxy-D-manno-octulosonate 8-phosphate phosphatase (KDO 8-P phosphatase)